MIDGFSGKEKAPAKGKNALSTQQRRAIWKAVLDASDKLDWKAISDESGLDTTKLKRHLREVLAKDVERMFKVT